MQFFVTALREYAVASYFYFIIKIISFSVIIDPLTSFPSECIAVNHLMTLSAGALI
jgi:hypothetical protein